MRLTSGQQRLRAAIAEMLRVPFVEQPLDNAYREVAVRCLQHYRYLREAGTAHRCTFTRCSSGGRARGFPEIEYLADVDLLIRRNLCAEDREACERYLRRGVRSDALGLALVRLGKVLYHASGGVFPVSSYFGGQLKTCNSA